MEYQETFKRLEKKYLLTTETYAKLRKAIDSRMQPDEYGHHTILNLYYDTPDYRLIRESLEKPIYKEKLRLRSYGIPAKNGDVFVEIKKKYKGVVYKRRSLMKLDGAQRFLDTGITLAPLTQIEQEIAYFVKRHAGVRPMAFISYEREALYWTENPTFRLTFDQNLRYRADQLDLSLGAFGERVLPESRVLMEIKIPGAMPMWMARVLSDLAIFPVSFSKYGSAYKQFVLGVKEDVLSA